MKSFREIILQHAKNSEEENEIAELLEKFIEHENSTAEINLSSLSRAQISSLREPIAETVDRLKNKYGFLPQELLDISEASSQARPQDS